MTEAARHALYARLVEVLGDEHTETLMSHLPPTGWADVATVHTQAQLGDQLRAEIAAVRVEVADVRAEVGQLRGDIGELRGEMGELRGEMGELRGEMGELRGEVHQLLRQQTVWLLGAMVTVNAVVATISAQF